MPFKSEKKDKREFIIGFDINEQQTFFQYTAMIENPLEPGVKGFNHEDIIKIIAKELLKLQGDPVLTIKEGKIRFGLSEIPEGEADSVIRH